MDNGLKYLSKPREQAARGVDMRDHQEDCPERIRLAEEYGEAVYDFNRRFQLLKRVSGARTAENWTLAEEARVRVESIWQSIENHLREHRCLELFVPVSEPVVERVACLENAEPMEFVLVTNNDREFVDASDMATRILRIGRGELLARRVDDVFEEANGESVAEAWDAFVNNGEQSGTCKTVAALGHRKFAYKARANFVPGVHVGVLHEIPQSEASESRQPRQKGRSFRR